MTERKKMQDGGPAFPRPIGEAPNAIGGGRFNREQSGMSLRDWFAGQALAGICGDGIPGSHHQPATTAHEAYAYADAMLAERSKAEGRTPAVASEAA